ncbi:MAG: 23S rRNA pseudouridine(1911/1915/1917) synthase RluD [Gammaproteobacteria bacterium]
MADTTAENRSAEVREHSAEVPPELAGQRLDQALAALFPDYSRSRLAAWVKAGRVTVDGQRLKPRDKVIGGEQVHLQAELEVQTPDAPQAIPLAILHEDEQVIVLDKPPGLVVHPGAGNRAGTLVNALLHHRPALASLPRAGLVHRLDKDTGGVMVVAATLEAHTSLVRQLQERTVSREYEAVCLGVLTGGGRVDAPVGRHPVDRKRMTVRDGGRPAVTHYRVLARFRGHTHILCRLETGRTHQIRVHMAHLRHPLVGDPLYGGRLAIPAGAGEGLATALRGFRRQALHARRLAFVHPASGETASFESPLPADFADLLAALEQDAAE